jgi:hypothetical protein
VETTLRLHNDVDGALWYGNRRVSAKPVDCGLEDFAQSKAFREAKVIRVVGVVENASLIERLHTLRKKAGLRKSIQIVSPSVSKSKNPENALLASWHASVSRGAGGYCIEMEDEHYSTYALVSELHKTAWTPSEKARRLLRFHPAWPAFSFLPTLDINKACMIAGLIIDPRWFTHPTRPNRDTKLFSFFGVCPKVVEDVLVRKNLTGGGRTLFSTLLGSWCSAGEPNIHDAGNFLHRILGSQDDEVRGHVIANKKYLKFVKQVWLQELSPTRHVFDPNLFFLMKDESQAYVAHKASLKNTRKSG